MKKYFIKLYFWFTRRWHKTSKGKWHVTTKWYPRRREFVPACSPWAIWKTTDVTKHTPPKKEKVCKTCKKLIRGGIS